MAKNFIAAGIQLNASVDRESNIRKAVELIGLAAGEGAKIVALPELFSTRWFPATIDRRHFSLAEEADGRTVSAMREASSRNKAVVIAPVFEKDGEDCYNTAFVIGPGGEMAGKYRKVHVPQIPLWEEKAYFKPGDLGFPVFETPFCKIGVLLSWDVFFPEAWRVLALKGAELVFAPTASAYAHSGRKWERAISAAAHANGVYAFRVNRVGKEDRQEFYGRSFCAGPDGEIMDGPSGSSVGMVLAGIDLAEIPRVRKEWVFLKDRRPEQYREIVE